MRVALLILLFTLWMVINFLIGEDWRNKKIVATPIEETAKWIVRGGCEIPGVRLMCTAEDKDFPLVELSIWDTLVGCFVHGVFFVFLLWLTTPLPDITANLLFVVNFEDRMNEDGNIDPPPPPAFPMWHPGGGEGPMILPLEE